MTDSIQASVVLRDDITSFNECVIYIFENDTLTNKKFSRQGYRFIVEETLKQHLGENDRHENLLKFNELGKPYVDSKYDIDFSYSHSQNGLVLAIVRAPNIVGIDYEDIRREQEVASQFLQAFSTKELTTISGKDCHIKQWCLKEAAVKMNGTGFLYANPQDLTCSTNSGEFKLTNYDETITSGHYKYLFSKQNLITICSTTKLINFSNAMQVTINDHITVIRRQVA